MTILVALGFWVGLSFVATPMIGAMISRRLCGEDCSLRNDSRIARQSGFRPVAVAIRLCPANGIRNRGRSLTLKSGMAKRRNY